MWATAFAAGTDIGQFTDFTDPKDGQAYEAQMEMVISKIETCKVPVIAALHGAVTGGGLVIASAVHVRIASAAAVAAPPPPLTSSPAHPFLSFQYSTFSSPLSFQIRIQYHTFGSSY